MRSVPLVQSLSRAFRWHRRWFAAVFAALAVLATLNAFSSPDSSGTSAVVAGRSIPGGTKVAAEDLRIVRLPPSVVPVGAFTDVGAVIGRTLVIPVPEKSVLTPANLLESGALVTGGKVALPVRFAEATALGLLHVGAHIDILGAAANGAGYGVVAADVRVVALPAVSDGGVLGSSQGALVLVEVDSTQAAAIAAAASVSAVSFALR
ncbi:MAG TPA: SAF domain-containing protein [Propionicimonas sp.]|uniref:SAF domain-containing protein n=1 Tax=Propionicimonas sp. TaxID=1955623 RepID=UPI002F3FF4D8